MQVKTNKVWKNVTKDHKVRAQKYFLPTRLKDLIEIIQMAEREGKRVKTVGSGHSYSTVALGKEYIVDPTNLRQLPPLKKEWLFPQYREPWKDPATQNEHQLFEVQSGITLQWLNKILERKKLALINMGAIDNQTISGAASTGTHGTGVTLPSVPGMIRSITLVASQGKVYKVEPASRPITNPENYNNPDIALIQDDHVFNSLLVNLGCMGIIYSYIIEVRKEFYLRETKTLTTWSKVKPLLQADEQGEIPLFEKDPDTGKQIYRGISVLINPYPTKKVNGDHSAMILRHQEIPKPDKRKFNEIFPNILGRIGGAIPIGLWIALQTLYDKPEKTPQLVDSALGSIKDKIYTNKSHKVLHQGVELIKNKALSSEFVIPLHNPTRDFVAVTEQLIKKAAAFAREGIYHSSPFSLRFVSQSHAYLSPENQGPVCYIDVAMLTATPHRKRLLNEYQDLVYRMGGFAHWGKINNGLVHFQEIIPQKFPNLHHWEDTFHQFNPNGTFSNVFSDHLNLGNITKPVA